MKPGAKLRKDSRNKENSRTDALSSSKLHHPTQKSIVNPSKVGGRNHGRDERNQQPFLRQFGTEITNTTTSASLVQPGGVKKTTGIKNKFFEVKAAHRIEEKIPQDAMDADMEVEEEKEGDFDMCEGEIDDQMEVDSEPSTEEKERAVLEDAKSKRAERRKAILKELEVCDLLNLRNPQQVAEYATTIYANMKQVETNFLVEKHFLQSTQIKEKHRKKLFEWLSEFLRKFKLLPETYFITCKLIDLTIAKSGCLQSELHLMSLGALLIAMKYEEIYPPSLKNIIRAASRDPEFTHDDVKKMEG